MPDIKTALNGADRPQLARGRRFRLQFSLRSLLIILLLVSIGMSWIGVKMHHARGQRRAVEAISELGGWVQYHWQIAGKTEPPGPGWLRELFGVDLFANVAQVSLKETAATDADLEHLDDLPHLAILDLADTQITDAGLEHLGRLNALAVLHLSGTGITDAGLEDVRDLSNLQELMLIETHVTDAGMEHLTGLVNLQVLGLLGTNVTREGVGKLQQSLPDVVAFGAR